MAVYKRGTKGVFYMNFHVNGVRVFKSTGVYTKREAKQVEALERQRLLDEQQMSPQQRRAKTLLQDAADQVYEAKWKHGKDGKRSYARACNLIKLIGNVPVGEIDEDVVALLHKKLDAKNTAPGTVNRYLASLKLILRFKNQDTDHIKLRKERKGRIRVISKDEEQQIVSLLCNSEHGKRRRFFPEIGELVVVLVDTGMRLGEALALKYDDIDFDSNLISIWFNKGDRPRSIPMTSRVSSILLARQKQNPIRPFALEQFQAQNAWRWVRKQMGLKQDREFVLHALRHTCASRLVNKGIDLYVVKEWLGHSTIQVTEKYAHLAPQKLAEAMSVLEED